MASPYYASGEDLKEKNRLATEHGFDIAAVVLDQLDLARPLAVLDAGAGWGRFAAPLTTRLRPGSTLVCADVSPGMVASCRETVGASAAFIAADVRRLPVGAGRFDLALANHMLYELDDVPAAIDELRRVLRRDGTLVATTYADDPDVPLLRFHRTALASVGVDSEPDPSSTFSLENGAALLGVAFTSVVATTVEERTRVDPDALTALYRRTGRYLMAPVHDGLAAAFHAAAVAAVRRSPGLETVTSWAIFVARDR